MNVRIREDSWVAKIAAAKLRSDKVAIVFGNVIHLHNTSTKEFLNDSDWVCHELKHVEQYKQHGFAGFIIKYLFEWIRHGYYKNKFEVEARENEKNTALIKNAVFIK